MSVLSRLFLVAAGHLLFDRFHAVLHILLHIGCTDLVFFRHVLAEGIELGFAGQRCAAVVMLGPGRDGAEH